MTETLLVMLLVCGPGSVKETQQTDYNQAFCRQAVISCIDKIGVKLCAEMPERYMEKYFFDGGSGIKKTMRGDCMEVVSKDLVALERIKPLEIFTPNGVDPLLDKIKHEVRAFRPDISTNKGRKDIASLANKIARSKTLLDGMGKELVSDWKEKAKLVDASRKKIRDELDSLKTEVRKPLTDWEENEAKRAAEKQALLDSVRQQTNNIEYLSAKDIAIRIDNLSGVFTHEDAGLVKQHNDETKAALDILKAKYDERVKYEKEQAELEQLRKEKLERDRKDYEDKIAKQAADRARRDAEEKAQREVERIRNEAERKEKEAKQRAEAEKQKEIQARLKAEREVKEAEQRRIAEEKQKKIDIENARKDEQRKIEAKKQADAEAEKKREANVQHRRKINREAMAEIMRIAALSEDQAVAIVSAIAKGQVPHIRIEY